MLSNGSRKKNSTKPLPSAFGTSPFALQTTSGVVVTVNTIVKPKPIVLNPAAWDSSQAPSSLAPSPSCSSHRPTPEREPPTRKRRASQLEASEGPRIKKQKSIERAKESSTPRSSRASSARRIGPAFGSLEKPIPRICVTSEDGAGPHVSSEDVVMRVLREQGIPKKTKKGYRAFFRNPSDPSDMSFEPDSPSLPVVEIQYPNHGASERFLLLFPWDKDDYQPVKEVVRTVCTIVDCYLTPAQREPFGSLTHSLFPLPTEEYRPASPVGGGTLSELHTTPLLRILERAYHKHDGPLFVKTMNEISAILASLRNEMMENARAWFDTQPDQSGEDAEGTSSGGVPVKLWKMIMEETYQRSVGPDVEETKKYKSFSSETYGELNPSFVSDIVHRLGLKPGKVFVDLGCGVGNCVFQAALQSGCDAYGIEINHPVASLSFKQRTEFAARLRMWGLTAGRCEVLEGDFCESDEVAEWIRKADVILVNNYIFGSDLNDRLTWRFLDLRDGAKLVVLKPFWPIKRPLTERTADTPEAVLTNVEKLEYFSDSVSWTKEPGDFYIYTKTSARPALAQGSRASSRLSR